MSVYIRTHACTSMYTHIFSGLLFLLSFSLSKIGYVCLYVLCLKVKFGSG